MKNICSFYIISCLVIAFDPCFEVINEIKVRENFQEAIDLAHAYVAEFQKDADYHAEAITSINNDMCYVYDDPYGDAKIEISITRHEIGGGL